jgi:ParB-like chromosome segregation protein Spo0J
VTRPVLLGEAPGPGGDPTTPLAGYARRFCVLADLNPGDDPYAALTVAFEPANAIAYFGDATPWDPALAKSRFARRAVATYVRNGGRFVVVAVGGRAARAVGRRDVDWYTWRDHGTYESVAVPHPSGRNLLWNDPATPDRVARALREALTRAAHAGETSDPSTTLPTVTDTTAAAPPGDPVVWAGPDDLRPLLRPIVDLKPFPGNPRRGDVPKLMESLRRWGQTKSISVTDDGTITAGHHLTRAARNLGWTHIAAAPGAFADRDDARDYLIADNQLSTLGHVEPSAQISLMEGITNFEGTGFTQEDLEDAQKLSSLYDEKVEIAQLKAHEKNYKKHTAEQLAHLQASLREHGIVRNIVIANDGTILAGHGVVEALKAIGMRKIPARRLPYGPDDPRALKVLAADNELTKLADVDDRTLTDVLKRIRDEGDVEALLGSGYDAMTLANLVMVTRPESEVKDLDAAAEWVGMPEFVPVGERYQLNLAFESPEDRDTLIRMLGVHIAKKHGQTWSAWWPPRQQEDLSSLRWETGEPGERGGLSVDSDEPLTAEDVAAAAAAMDAYSAEVGVPEFTTDDPDFAPAATHEYRELPDSGDTEGTWVKIEPAPGELDVRSPAENAPVRGPYDE